MELDKETQFPHIWRLQDVLKTSSDDVWQRRIFVLIIKASSKRLPKTKANDVFKTSSPRRILSGLSSLVNEFYWSDRLIISPWDLTQIAIKLGTKHVVYQRLANFFICFLFLSGFSFTNIHKSRDRREGNSLNSHYHFHPLYRYLDISRAIIAESSPVHMIGSRTRTGYLWFPSASC